MFSRNVNILAGLMVVVFLSGCGSTPTTNVKPATTANNREAPVVFTQEDIARQGTAKRFLHNIGAGDLMVASFEATMEEQARKQPELAELLNRAFADLSQDDFESAASEVYARHMTHKDLVEIADLSEKDSIKKFFKEIFDGVLTGKPVDQNALIQKFSAEELTDIMELSLSESFLKLKKVLPTINKELKVAGKKLGEKTLKEYIKNR